MHPSGLDTADTSGAPVDTGALELEACEQPDLGDGRVFGPKSCTDGICEIVSGTFIMGDANPERPEQCPPRIVELSEFAIDEHEVNNHEWDACVNAGVCVEAPVWCESLVPMQEHDELPVVCISWYEASDYCAWVGRLPDGGRMGKGGTRYRWAIVAMGQPGTVMCNSQLPLCGGLL